jgi:hypothetical protein
MIIIIYYNDCFSLCGVVVVVVVQLKFWSFQVLASFQFIFISFYQNQDFRFNTHTAVSLEGAGIKSLILIPGIRGIGILGTY